MTDRILSDLLERAGDRTEVGPPPLEAMLRGVRRRRRRHAVLGGAGLTLATAATAILVPVLAHSGDEAAPLQPPAPQSSAPVVTPPRQSVDLKGTWVVSALVGRNGKSALPRHSDLVRIRFHHGKVEADTGCNVVSGTYRQRGQLLRFPARNLVTTAVGCQNEPPLAPRLSDVRTVSRDPGGTYLEDAAGRVVVALTRP